MVVKTARTEWLSYNFLTSINKYTTRATMFSMHSVDLGKYKCGGEVHSAHLTGLTWEYPPLDLPTVIHLDNQLFMFDLILTVESLLCQASTLNFKVLYYFFNYPPSSGIFFLCQDH